MSCTLNHTCSQLRQLLRQLDVDETNVATECDDTSPCQSAFDNALLVMAHLNIDNATLVSDFIRARYQGQLPIDGSDGTVRQIFDRRPFACPELDIEIRQPCSTQSCAYWTNHAWTRNCILFYRADQGHDSLDFKELSFLLDHTTTELRKRANVVLAEMRRWALLHKAEQVDAPVAPVLVIGDGCVVCGAEADDDSIYKLGFQYCSTVCFDLKPSLDLRIEQEFKLPVARVLSICIDSFAAKRPMCHALNVTAKQLDDLCARHDVLPYTSA
ncbi:hypothetical protein LCGC14_0829600 [marine sediment metagenome]|uniref:Uncharacterized protein n=1 Tax=marine sediment metagenome TaxID=412755 RepID=A0A0F9PGD9_9ZZZZ